jgi:MoaA/NifB/PqqE/SkfB family radical SAM enzyme
MTYVKSATRALSTVARMPQPLDHRSLYRLPWNLADNPIAWLEPTQACNLACDGCYRANVKTHKSLAEVGEDLDVFARLRNHDGVSIAGGDPLTHPLLTDIVRMVTSRGRKAIINTNGLALTTDTLRALKDAGLVGITFHVDSKQGRPGWRNKTEVQMNELRSRYAEMVARVGGISCAFNATVYEDTLHEVPDLVAWAEQNIGLVDTMVFIQYRAAVRKEVDYFAGAEKVDVSRLVYSSDKERRTDITAREVAGVIRDRFPDFEPCAYLNATSSPDSFKWLIALRVGSKGRTHGWLGPRFMEAVQTTHHFVNGRYLSYAPRWTLGHGRAAMAVAWPWDGGARNAAVRWAKALALHPIDALRRQHVQAIVMIQPIDILEDGREDMCDGCPDMTVHDGKLMWSCRLEEPRTFGCFLRAVPKCAAGDQSKLHGLPTA